MIFRNKKQILAGAVIAAAVFLVFMPALGSSPMLVSDDMLYVGTWARLELSVENIIYYFKTPILFLHSPLVMMTFMIDKLIWGENLAWGAGCVNALLHSVSAVLFFTLLNMLHFYRRGKRSLRIPLELSALIAFLWAVHPQRAESVAWICERKDCLVALLFLGAAVSFVRSYRKNKYDIAGTVMLAASFLCKPMLITFPAAAAVFIFCETRGRGIVKKLKYLIPSAAVSLVYFTVNITQVGKSASNNRLLDAEKLLEVFANVGRYCGKSFFPAELCTYYPEKLPLSDMWYWLILLLPLLLLFFEKSRKYAIYVLAPCVVLFLIIVAPVSGIIPIGGSDFADRYSYIPSLFLFCAAAFAASLLVQRYERARLWVCAALALLAILSIAEVRVVSQSYRDEKLFQESAIAVENPHWRNLFSYGHRLLHEKRYVEAYNMAENFHIPSDASGERKVAFQTFKTSVKALSMIYLGNVEHGLPMLDSVLFSKNCVYVRDVSLGFARDTMNIAAKLHLQRGNVKKAAHIFGMLSDLYGELVPEERDFCLGVRAMILRNYPEAVMYFERLAAKYSNERIISNLNEARRRAALAQQQAQQ